jgi:hypothetical protein
MTMLKMVLSALLLTLMLGQASHMPTYAESDGDDVVCIDKNDDGNCDAAYNE